MEINQRKTGVILSYLQTGINAAVGFIYIPLLIHFLGQKEYGLYQLMGSFLVYLSLFDFGLSNTVTRYYSKYIALKDEKGKENLLAISFVIYVVLTMILVVAGVFFYFFLDETFSNSLTKLEIVVAKKMYIIILITIAISISTTVFNSIITAHERFFFLKFLPVVQTIMRPIIVLSVFLIQANAFNLVIVESIINIVGVLLNIYYSFKKIQVKIKLHYWDKPLLKEMLRYSFFIFITALMDQIFWRSDQVILGIVNGTVSVAIYSIASQIVMYYMNLSTAMSGVFLPNITKRVMENVSSSELTNVFVKVGRLQYILLGAVLIGFILYGKEFITIWVGESFKDSYYITLLIIIPFTIDLIQNIGLTILQAKNMYSFRAAVFFIMSLINIVCSIPLAMYYGGIGTAFITGFSYLIGNGIVMNIYYYRKVNLNIFKFWKAIGRLSVPMIIPYILGMYIKEINIASISPIYSFLIKLFLFSISYFIIIWKFGMNSYEKNLILVPSKLVLKTFK